MKNEEILQLVDEIKQGNKIAENKLYTNLFPFIYLTCYKILNNKEDAEDLTNESFVKIFKSIETYETKCTFLTWAGTITKNNCKNFIRSKSYKFLQLTHNDDNSLFEIPTLSKDDILDKSVNERFGSYDIQLCINKLNPLEKQLIDLVYFQGYKVKELYDIFTDLDSRYIRLKLYRARNKMRYNLLQLEKNKSTLNDKVSRRQIR